MRLKPKVLVLAAVMVWAMQAGSQEAVRLTSVNWLAGSWRMEKAGKMIEEQWTTPVGGMMLGVSRTVEMPIEKTVEFEFLRIEQRGDSLVYIAQPGGRPPTEFKLESATDSEVVFANLQHDFPKKIRYTRNTDGSVTARVEDETGKKAIAFPYKAVK
jgi:hypothetical protein